MQITVKSTTKQSAMAQGKVYWGVKSEDGNWYNVITNEKPALNTKIEAEVKESNFNGRTYRWATPISREPKASAAISNGHIAWEDYKRMALEAGNLAHMLESDLPGDKENGDPFVDRSQARAAIVNTLMIAFSNGKIALPKDEEPESVPPGAEIPF